MKKLYVYALVLSLYASASFCALDEQEVARLQALSRVDACLCKFEEVLQSLDHVTMRSGRYVTLVMIAMKLIEIAGSDENGLALAEKVVLYQRLLSVHNQAIMSFNDGEVPMHFMALKRVMVDKIVEYKAQAVKNNESKQEVITDEQ